MKPIARRSASRGICSIATPSMNKEFGGALYSLGISSTSVDFPDPVAPTIATVFPFGIASEMFVSVGVPL